MQPRARSKHHTYLLQALRQLPYPFEMLYKVFIGSSDTVDADEGAMYYPKP